MQLSDLKVESASVQVSNASQIGAKFKISANIETRDGKLTRINGGTVIVVEGNTQVANFSKDLEYGKNYNVNFMSAAFEDKEMQCEINDVIHQYIALTENKAYQEISE